MRRSTLTGVVVGVSLACLVLVVVERKGVRAEPLSDVGPSLSDSDGTLRELVIHYVAEAAPVCGRAYESFLPQLPARVRVHVVCESRAEYDYFRRRLGPLRCALLPVIVEHPITCWSRDRWLALAPPEGGRHTTLLLPKDEDGAAAWPRRAGDGRVGDDLAARLGDDVRSARSTLYFDGGDFAADAETVFVTPAVLARNLQRTVKTREELLRRLGAVLKRRVVLLDEAPPHHAGMFLMPIGGRRVLVGDPSLAKPLFEEAETLDSLLASGGGPDFSAETQRLFDAVARQCESEGCRVVRMPVVPGRDGRTWLTPLNAVIDDGTVHMPVYGGAEPLNCAAAAVWREAGFAVREVDCTDAYPRFGSLRCLVSVLARGQGAADDAPSF